MIAYLICSREYHTFSFYRRFKKPNSHSKFHFISSFLYDTTSKIYRKYRQRIDSLRKGMVLESDARQREAEEKAIDEIAGTSESLADKGKRLCGLYLILYPACSK